MKALRWEYSSVFEEQEGVGGLVNEFTGKGMGQYKDQAFTLSKIEATSGQ